MTTEPRAPRPARRPRRPAWVSWDLGAGILVGIVVACVALWQPETLRSGPSALLAVMGLGAGLVGVSLAALSLMLAFLTEDYIAVLLKTTGRVISLWRPYALVAWVAAITAAASLCLYLAWRALPEWAQASLVGLVIGMAVWSIVGVAQLVGISRFHGEQKFELLRQKHAARDLLEERRRHKSA